MRSGLPSSLPRLSSFRRSLLVLALALAAGGLAGRAEAQIVFETPLPTNGDGLAQRALAGDLNEDGLADIVVSHATVLFSVNLSVCFGTGGGAFTAPQLVGGPANRIGAIADFNADGHLDLLAWVAFTGGPSSALVMLGDGTGAFPLSVPVNGNLGAPISADAGDFDSDGALDVVVSNGFLGFSAGAIYVSFGNGDGSFEAPLMIPTQPPVDFSGGGRVRVGDTNGDGFDDFVWVGTFTLDTTTLLSNGRGGFEPVDCTDGCGIMSDADFVLADVTGDGREDIVTSVRVMPAKPNGAFSFGQVLPLANTPIAVDVGDLDGDGVLDVAIGRNATTTLTNPTLTVGEVFVLRGNGNGTFQTPGLIVSHVPQPRSIAIADLDSDGRSDLLAACFQNAPGSAQVLLNHTYAPGSPFLDLGGALGGSNGWPIQLATGTLVAGQPFSFKLQSGPPSGAAFHVVGLSRIDAPFKGGVMIPALNLVNGPFPLSASGALNLAGNWPAGASGLTLYTQFWMPNGGGPVGLVASSGVRAQVP